eukprot:11039-Heterococcus_DN1.PRE.1
MLLSNTAAATTGVLNSLRSMLFCIVCYHSEPSAARAVCCIVPVSARERVALTVSTSAALLSDKHAYPRLGIMQM